MADSKEDNEPFVIGLAMAGAISAGAYTAGVLDFLFRAIASHNARVGQDKGPKHRVVIKAMSGTSAGGVSTAGAIASLVNISPDELSANTPPHTGDGYEYALKPLHDIWVENLTLRDPGGGAGLLGTGDLLDPTTPLTSALDSDALDNMADKALSDIRWHGKQHSVVCADLDLFLTVTSLSGVPYSVGFANNDGTPSHHMAQHAIVKHFRVDALGEGEFPSAWLEQWKDHGRQLSFKHLKQADGTYERLPLCIEDKRNELNEVSKNWRDLRTVGVATGAFPGGFSARFIHAPASDYGLAVDGEALTGGAWPIEADPQTGLEKQVRPDLDDKGQFNFFAVDGGLCNNEPFEYARYAIRKRSSDTAHWELKSNPREPSDSTRAVIMIDPFPEGPKIAEAREDDDQARALPAVFVALKAALIDQARFKLGELLEASNPNTRSRFLISPSRTDRHKRKVHGAEALASGFLGGFGGFFDKKIREHDFVLGQRNCQSFLKNYFSLAKEATVLNGSTMNAPASRELSRNGEVPIVFLDDALLKETILPSWPRMEKRDLVKLLDAADKRIEAAAARLTISLQSRKLLWAVIARLWRGGFLISGGADTIRNFLRRSVAAELLQRDQCAELTFLSGEEIDSFDRGANPAEPHADRQRRVIADLIAPGPDWRTIGGIARRTKLPSDVVFDVIEKSNLPILRGPLLSDERVQSYALNRPGFFPNWLHRTWGTRHVLGMLTPTSNDLPTSRG